MRNPYDDIAKNYDSFFTDPDSQAENKIITNLLAPAVKNSQKLLDVGCGTGFILDQIDTILPSRYIGIDPSQGMISRLLEKHPKFIDSVFRSTFQEYLLSKAPLSSHDLVLALFGSASYLRPSVVSILIEQKQVQFFFMFYREGYTPVTYKKHGESVPHYDLPNYRLNKRCGMIIEFNNFVIATNLKHLEDGYTGGKKTDQRGRLDFC